MREADIRQLPRECWMPWGRGKQSAKTKDIARQGGDNLVQSSRSGKVCKKIMFMQRFPWRLKEQDFSKRLAQPQGLWSGRKPDAGTFVSSTGRYFPATTIPTLKQNAAQITLTIKLYRKFHFFLFFLRLSERYGGTRRGTKLEVRKLFALKLTSRNYHFVPNLNLH